MKIQPARSLKGIVRLPGDKSISHRAAILASMATGETRIENYATNADCSSTLDCLRNLGVDIRQQGSTVFVKGVGKNGFTKPTKELDCGNSGTTMRLLAGVLVGQNFDSVLTGDESLSKRPMRRIIKPLTEMGAKIESENDHAPLKIYGGNPLQSVSYDLPVASAQVKSCILLAGLKAGGKSAIRNPQSAFKTPTSRNHTELMLRYLGAEIEEYFVETDGGFVQTISVSGANSKLAAKDLNVPSDISSAAFFIVAASCLESSEIKLENVGLNPTRTAILDVLQSLGADIRRLNQREICNEPVGDLLVRGKRSEFAPSNLKLIDADVIANLIDEIPILAVFATQLENGLTIRGAAELRVKESDRIKAIVENLRRMNATVEEFSDGFRVEKSALKGATIDSFGDHRIAMAFAVAALLATGETQIVGATAAGVSFPEFFQTLARLEAKGKRQK